MEQPAAPSGDEGNEQHLIEAGHGTDMADSIVFLWQFARCCHFCRCINTISKLNVRV